MAQTTEPDWFPPEGGPVASDIFDPLDTLEVYIGLLQNLTDNDEAGALLACIQEDALDRATEQGGYLDRAEAIISAAAPSGWWFGPHPDDSACVGFWPIGQL